MADGFQYFSSDDSGAPVLNGAAGRMIAVLDWALVGKGGWTKAYSGTNLAAYRSDSGNRFYLRLDDTQAQYARLRGYRTMSAVSTGASPFPTTSQAPANTWGMRKSWSSGSTARKYWGIRTNKYLLMVVQHVTTADDGYDGDYRQVWGFGDVPTVCESDAWNTMLLPGNANDITAGDTYYPINALSNSTGPTGSFAGNYGGMPSAPDGSLSSPNSGIVSRIGNLNYAILDYSASWGKAGRVHFEDELIISSQSSSASGSNGGYWRAKMPNLKSLSYGIGLESDGANSPWNPVNDLETVTFGSRQFKAFMARRAPGTVSAGFLLEVTDTDGAL